jgi:hypothetical protein
MWNGHIVCFFPAHFYLIPFVVQSDIWLTAYGGNFERTPWHCKIFFLSYSPDLFFIRLALDLQ